MMCGITGTPGTGKSSVGTELSRRGHTVIRLADSVRPYVIGTDKERDTELIDVDRWIEEFVAVDGFIEGHFVHMLPCDQIVVLRCRPDVLKTRLALRNYPEKKIRENVQSEALDTCLIETVEIYEPGQILELDATTRDAMYCADQIERFVNGEIPASFGTLDWSEFLEVQE
jgi:adenylate kinase